jgi:hypothetical protein
MTIQEIKNQVEKCVSTKHVFTSRQIADELWPDLAKVDHRGVHIHPYAAQVSIAIKMICGLSRNKKTKVYKNLKYFAV